ncbi:LacI family DNA-binding transcriptional regulator, partial [Streptacidiphilus melanogenes]|uniref:LacI family DNA-binding transcriptional regulator n=1 Tax=Streptacidiphilus melanogenes TaxID=411235 RepID=UPI003F6F3A6D
MRRGQRCRRGSGLNRQADGTSMPPARLPLLSTKSATLSMLCRSRVHPKAFPGRDGGKQMPAGTDRPGVPIRPTMKDVAAAAGVGLKTVSRVVNGEAGVSEATAG